MLHLLVFVLNSFIDSWKKQMTFNGVINKQHQFMKILEHYFELCPIFQPYNVTSYMDHAFSSRSPDKPITLQAQ